VRPGGEEDCACRGAFGRVTWTEVGRASIGDGDDAICGGGSLTALT